MFVFPQIHLLKSLTPNVIVLGGGGFGRWLGGEGGALMNEISALIKETQESSLAPSTMLGYSKKTAVYEPGWESSPDTKSASILILDFLATRTVRNNICCLKHPVFIFVIAAQME